MYSFQFGASGNSTVTKTETIITSDGSSTEYTGTFTNTPIDGTISVTDETYSWNDVDGNPGEQATAYIIIINGFVIYADIENGGSGYDDDNPPLVTITGDGSGATATATVENGVITGITITGSGLNYTEGNIVIAPPPAPFTVDKVNGNLEVGYGASPSYGTGVVATYKTLEPSIIGALSEASSHWLELTVDGTAQNPRERILSVPFAQVAGTVSGIKEDIKKLKNDSQILRNQIVAIFNMFSNQTFIPDGRQFTNDYPGIQMINFRNDSNEIFFGIDSIIDGKLNYSSYSPSSHTPFSEKNKRTPTINNRIYINPRDWTNQATNYKISSYSIFQQSVGGNYTELPIKLKFNYIDGTSSSKSLRTIRNSNYMWHETSVTNPYPDKIVTSVEKSWNGSQRDSSGNLHWQKNLEYFYTDAPYHFTVKLNENIRGKESFSLRLSSQALQNFYANFEFLNIDGNIVYQTNENDVADTILKQATHIKVTINPIINNLSGRNGGTLDGFLIISY